MPDTALPPESESQKARRARDEAQLIIGQMHGVLSLAVNDVDTWLPIQSPPTSDAEGEPELTADDIRAAAVEVHAHFGAVHAALNTGEHDAALAQVGISGAQGSAKRKGLLPAISRLFRERLQLRNDAAGYSARLRACLRWGMPILGSITAAIPEEIGKFHGAHLAGEAIKEFMELLGNALEARDSRKESRATQKG